MGTVALTLRRLGMGRFSRGRLVLGRCAVLVRTAMLGRVALIASVALILLAAGQPTEAKTQKPPLHGRHWMAITGKPLAATAGAMIFQKGGNAIDAACAMIAATSTMYDTLSWGGETQALIYNPNTGKV